MAAITQEITDSEARAIARDAWIYAFPMMESYKAWYPQAVLKESPKFVGGFNTFRHYHELFTPANKTVVTPNNDTPYSWAWMDLRSEPIVISVPGIPEHRYYVLQLIDLFAYNCAYIGSRSTGNGAGDYLVAGPQWRGRVPRGFKKVIRSETQIVGILGRTQLNGPEDLENVKKVQAGFRLTPLSEFLKTQAPPAATPLAFPPYESQQASTHDFIRYLNFLLALAEPPHSREVALRERFARIGIGPGKPWDAAKVGASTLAAIDAGVRDAQQELKEQIAVTQGSIGLFGARKALGENYLQRAVAAAMGLYGNDLEEAWYGGFVGDGNQLSKIRFAKGQLPPAKFFWSVTLYTLPDRFLYANPLNRYSIGDRTRGLHYDPDGGLTIYVGNLSPGPAQESNWLPAPAGPYSFVARVYGPTAAARKGRWKLPPLETVGNLSKIAETARDAYIYGIPMFGVWKTMYAFNVAKDNPQYKGPFNTVLNIARVFTPDDRAFVTPNSDTPYTFASLDLRAEPVVLTIPKMEKERYFVFQLMDLYTFNFAYIGSRTTGNEGGTYLIAGPKWQGEGPKGITKVIRAETELVSVVGRTQLFNAGDLDQVKRIQAGYGVQPLSVFLRGIAPPAPPPVAWIKPLSPAAERHSPEFFNELAFLLQFAEPPHPSEKALRQRFAEIGIEAGKQFDTGQKSPERRAALAQGMAEGQRAIDAKRASLGGKTDSLFGDREYLKNNFLARATGTQVAIGANSREEALYPILDRDADGKPLEGAHGRYTLRFAPGQLPPVNAFWSVTMYDLPKQLLVKNPLHRYLINSSMLPHLKMDADGGLTLYIQADSPGREREANWLPAPKGPFVMFMRYYWPKPELLEGEWKTPAVVKTRERDLAG